MDRIDKISDELEAGQCLSLRAISDLVYHALILSDCLVRK